MKQYKLYEQEFSPIIEHQRINFFKSLGVKNNKGTFTIGYTDKNYKCLPFLESVLDSKIQGLSFFSGGGGLDIGAQMAGIKVLSSLDFEKVIIALKQYRLYHSNDTASLAWLQVSLFTWLAIPV